MSQPVVIPSDIDWATAWGYLSTDKTQEFLGHLAFQEVTDYSPLDEGIRRITYMARICFAEPPLNAFGQIDTEAAKYFQNWKQRVQIVPRGSFASRTGIRGFADLDLDIIFPDDYMVPVSSTSTDFADIATVLGMDAHFEKILFEPDSLKFVLQFIWFRLSLEYRQKMYNDAAIKLQFPTWWNENWVILRRTPNDFTRSIDAKAVASMFLINKDNGPLDVDLFLKLRTKMQGHEVIVGVDKDAPDGTRRLQTTQFMPIPGQWIGDRILGPVDRTALLTLKWWKTALKYETGFNLKSHHLLSALNACHELDPDDQLYLPTTVSGTFSNTRVMLVMENVLRYVSNAYTSPCYFLLKRGSLGTDYAFPQFTRGLSDILLIQFLQDVGWPKYQAFIKQNFLLLFANQLTAARADIARQKALINNFTK